MNAVAWVNATPTALSLFYDLDLLPEQLIDLPLGHPRQRAFLILAAHLSSSWTPTPLRRAIPSILPGEVIRL